MARSDPQAQQFLDKWIRMRAAENKGLLGGRQLAKIKDQYADFLPAAREVRGPRSGIWSPSSAPPPPSR
jgi:hypothetical protein